MSKINALVYVREYFKNVYLPMFSSVPGLQVTYLTDFPTSGMINLRDHFYPVLNECPDTELPSFDIEDVISRCRLLRNIERTLAVTMARAMYATLWDISGREDYTVFVGQMVDDYITHLMSIIASVRGVRYVGLCDSYFPEHTQVTLHSDGSPIWKRDVEEEEARVVLDKIKGSRFRQDYQQQSRYTLTAHTRRVGRYYAKRIVFALLKRYHRDPLNYHYNVQTYLAQHRSIFNYVTGRHFDSAWEQKLDSNAGRLVYIPLGYFPEASTDYWVPNARFLDYENTMLEFVSALARESQVVVKEHFHMLGIRAKRFYERLGGIEGVIQVPPETNSNYIIEKYMPTVLVGGGSVGVEATLRNVPVVTFCSTSFWCEPSTATIVHGDSIRALLDAIRSAQPGQIEPIEFVQRCLATTVPFNYLDAAILDQARLVVMKRFLGGE